MRGCANSGLDSYLEISFLSLLNQRQNSYCGKYLNDSEKCLFAYIKRTLVNKTMYLSVMKRK